MSDLVEKLRALEQRLSTEKGEFRLFGLFLREEAPGKWDLVVAAPWLQKDKKTGLDHLTRGLRAALSSDELLQLSRVVVLDDSDPAIDSLAGSIRVKHGRTEIRDSELQGLEIKRGWVVTSTGSA